MKRDHEFDYEIFDYVDFDAGVLRTVVSRNNIPYSAEDIEQIWIDGENRLA